MNAPVCATSTANPSEPRPRVGDWIMTVSGRHFWPLDPQPAEVHLADIAHALANTCRFTGHCRQFYSVAQHAVLVANLVERLAPELALAALHHDDAEAYLADVAHPVKRFLWFDAEIEGTVEHHAFRNVERKLDLAIATALGLDHHQLFHPVITTADHHALRLEWDALMLPLPAGSWLNEIAPPNAPTLYPQTPDEARCYYLTTHDRLVQARADRLVARPSP